MAPIRRYLRITKYSVLECRIYVDNPALAESWLLNSRNPVLPRVIESVRPLVLPKLREENQRSKAKGKKKSVKDVVIEEDFEVSIFLTEISARHSLLTKQKHFKDLNKKGIQSNSSKLMGATNDTAIVVQDAPFIRHEDSAEDVLNLQDVPAADEDEVDGEEGNHSGDSSSDDSLFVSAESAAHGSKRSRARADTGSRSESTGTEPASKRLRNASIEEETDDKKKMAMDTSYDGFSIYGRVLCLVVKRRDKKGKGAVGFGGGGQAMMEDWISTQMPQPDEDDGS